MELSDASTTGPVAEPLTFGTSGVGSPNHMSGELLKMMAGIDIVHVPYKGYTPALTDAAGGQIDMVFAGVPALQPFLKSALLRAIDRRQTALRNFAGGPLHSTRQAFAGSKCPTSSACLRPQAHRNTLLRK
jgi:hypothetical protein